MRAGMDKMDTFFEDNNFNILALNIVWVLSSVFSYTPVNIKKNSVWLILIAIVFVYVNVHHN